MSYCNSIFSVIVNLLKKKDNEPNYKIGIKTLFYSIFNPWAGFLISSIILIDSCKCGKSNDYNAPGFWVSLLAFLLSLFLMVCPYFICIELYIMKNMWKYSSILSLKIRTYIYRSNWDNFIFFFFLF